MKKIQTSIAVLLLLAAVSCKKTDNSAAAVVSTDQIADVTSNALSFNSSGLSANFDAMATNAQSLSSVTSPGKTVNATSTGGSSNTVDQGCGTTVIDSTTKSSTIAGAAFAYFLKYTHTLNCNPGGQHDNIVFDLSFNGSFDGTDIASKDTGSSAFTIAGFTTNTTDFLVNGHYNRHGAFTSKVGDKVSGTSDVTIVVTSLTISKSKKSITGGSATISITIKVPKGTKTFTGALTFNGDGTANFTVDCTVYSINLLTGVRTKH
jgi:hypothetical protein